MAILGVNMTETNLAAMTATELSALYKTGAASPVEATQAVLARAAALNPDLNAFCLIDSEGALQAARDSERRWKAGAPLSPLDGVPTSLKEALYARGWPTLMGSKAVDPNQNWEADSPVTARLRAAGAVLFAQTTSPEYGHKGVTDSLLHGITRNPWNLARTPGGSSGGAGAAVAARIGPLAIGTDGGGSIRVPAALCGIFGLKPTYGRVPSWPHGFSNDLGNTGPMTRTVRDAALMMNEITKPDIRDAYALPPAQIDYVAALDAPVKNLKIGYVLQLGTHEMDPEIADSVRAAAQRFTELGCEVEEFTPDLGDIDAGLLFGTHWACFMQRILQIHPPEAHKLLDPGVVGLANWGSSFSSADLVAAMALRAELAERWNLIFGAYDLVLCPATASTAFDVGIPAPLGKDGQPNLLWTPFAYHFNLSRHPAASVPCGVSAAGLPIGMMLASAHYREDLILRAAHAYQQSWPTPLPDLAG